MRRLTAVLVVAALLLFPRPAGATHTTIHVRCQSLVDRVNLYRSDLRLRYLLCTVAHERARAMAARRAIWHDLRPVIRALAAAGVCWRNVGEVVAWNTYSATARAFVSQWRASSAHWSLLMATRYDRGGGSWTSVSGRHYAVMYVLDTC